MSFDHPRLVVLGHHPLGARTRYVFLTIAALPLLLLASGDWSFNRRWLDDLRSLKGEP